jgi:hypothetical protein
MKQSAVEWLILKIIKQKNYKDLDWDLIFEQAKEMEKKQQDDFAIEFLKWCENESVFNPSVIHKPSYEKLLEYYIETFKKK